MTENRRRINDMVDDDLDKVIRTSVNEETKVLAIFMKNINNAIRDIVNILNDQKDSIARSDNQIAAELHLLNEQFRAHERKYTQDKLEEAVAQTKINGKLAFWNRIGTVAASSAIAVGTTALIQYTEVRDTALKNANDINYVNDAIKSVSERVVEVEKKIVDEKIERLTHHVNDIKKKRVIQASK